MKQNSSQQTTL